MDGKVFEAVKVLCASIDASKRFCCQSSKNESEQSADSSAEKALESVCRRLLNSRAHMETRGADSGNQEYCMQLGHLVSLSKAFVALAAAQPAKEALETCDDEALKMRRKQLVTAMEALVEALSLLRNVVIAAPAHLASQLCKIPAGAALLAAMSLQHACGSEADADGESFALCMLKGLQGAQRSLEECASFAAQISVERKL